MPVYADTDPYGPIYSSGLSGRPSRWRVELGGGKSKRVGAEVIELPKLGDWYNSIRGKKSITLEFGRFAHEDLHTIPPWYLQTIWGQRVYPICIDKGDLADEPRGTKRPAQEAPESVKRMKGVPAWKLTFTKYKGSTFDLIPQSFFNSYLIPQRRDIAKRWPDDYAALKIYLQDNTLRLRGHEKAAQDFGIDNRVAERSRPRASANARNAPSTTESEFWRQYRSAVEAGTIAPKYQDLIEEEMRSKFGRWAAGEEEEGEVSRSERSTLSLEEEVQDPGPPDYSKMKRDRY